MMHLHLSPDTPAWLGIAAAGALVAHITAGGLALASGATAVLARKGDTLHRRAGSVFVAAMMITATAAIFMAAIIPQHANLATGILTFYLVVSGWLTAAQKDGAAGFFNYAGLLAVLAAGVLFAAFGVEASRAPHALLDGYPAMAYYIVSAFGLVASGLDLSVIVRGGLTGFARIRRHMWRMCLALFFATGSFFLGQQQVLPAVLRGSPYLFIPALAPLAVMAFWGFRLSRKSKFGRAIPYPDMRDPAVKEQPSA